MHCYCINLMFVYLTRRAGRTCVSEGAMKSALDAFVCSKHEQICWCGKCFWIYVGSVASKANWAARFTDQKEVTGGQGLSMHCIQGNTRDHLSMDKKSSWKFQSCVGRTDHRLTTERPWFVHFTTNQTGTRERFCLLVQQRKKKEFPWSHFLST